MQKTNFECSTFNSWNIFFQIWILWSKFSVGHPSYKMRNNTLLEQAKRGIHKVGWGVLILWILQGPIGSYRLMEGRLISSKKNHKNQSRVVIVVPTSPFMLLLLKILMMMNRIGNFWPLDVVFFIHQFNW
jgi:hypothetical protein